MILKVVIKRQQVNYVSLSRGGLQVFRLAKAAANKNGLLFSNCIDPCVEFVTDNDNKQRNRFVVILFFRQN